LPDLYKEDAVARCEKLEEGEADGAHASQGHDGRLHPFGENLAGGGGLTPSGAVDLWASEKDQYVFDPTYDFVAGHYTQIVWRDSIEIGCGIATCAGARSVASCRYHPPGNVIGQQPY